MEKIISLLLDQSKVCTRPFVPHALPVSPSVSAEFFLKGKLEVVKSSAFSLRSQKDSGEQLRKRAIFMQLLIEQSWWKCFFWNFCSGKFHFLTNLLFCGRWISRTWKEKKPASPTKQSKYVPAYLAFEINMLGFVAENDVSIFQELTEVLF